MKLAILKPPKYVEAKAKKGNWFRRLWRLLMVQLWIVTDTNIINLHGLLTTVFSDGQSCT